MSEEERLYTIAEVAQELKINRDTVYEWIGKGIIEVVRPKKRMPRITQDTLDYLRAHIIPADQRLGKSMNYLLR